MDNISLMRRARQSLASHWVEAAIATLIFLILTSLLDSTVIGLLIAGPLMFGYILYCMCLADTGQSRMDLLFQGFSRFADTMVAGLLVTLAIGIGSIFLIVPGIWLACGFSMTFFLMADDPNLSGTTALQQSWNMMKGHKWEYFCLMLRFIGWILLSIITCGVLYLWVTPYMTIASLGYYRKLRGIA